MQNQRLSLLLILFFSLAFFIFIITISNNAIAQTTTSSTNESYHFIKQWGINGTGDGQFLPHQVLLLIHLAMLT